MITSSFSHKIQRAKRSIFRNMAVCTRTAKEQFNIWRQLYYYLIFECHHIAHKTRHCPMEILLHYPQYSLCYERKYVSDML